MLLAVIPLSSKTIVGFSVEGSEIVTIPAVVIVV